MIKRFRRWLARLARQAPPHPPSCIYCGRAIGPLTHYGFRVISDEKAVTYYWHTECYLNQGRR